MKKLKDLVRKIRLSARHYEAEITSGGSTPSAATVLSRCAEDIEALIPELLADRASLIQRIPHKRERAGVANPDSVGYLRFIYKCKADCLRCALEKGN